jgi:uncharacterized protein YajQ (UPF0234 family)
VELNKLPLGSEKEKREATNTIEQKKKELRRVYRKLKGVRSQISMKTKELKKEVRETDLTCDDDSVASAETDAIAEDDIEDNRRGDDQETKQKGGVVATQFELKMLVDHKAKLRKRFQQLLGEVQTK